MLILKPLSLGSITLPAGRGLLTLRALDIPGAELEGLVYGVDFMKDANLGRPLNVGRDVVVVGGGYTAMDCARTSLRHGAERVTIAYRRTRSELVVDEEELGETEREGVRMDFLVSPLELVGENGRITGVKMIKNRLGEPDASGRRSPIPIEGSEYIVPADPQNPADATKADQNRQPTLPIDNFNSQYGDKYRHDDGRGLHDRRQLIDICTMVHQPSQQSYLIRLHRTM